MEQILCPSIAKPVTRPTAARNLERSKCALWCRKLVAREELFGVVREAFAAPARLSCFGVLGLCTNSRNH